MPDSETRKTPAWPDALLVALLTVLCCAQCAGFGFLNYDDPVTLGLDGNPRPGLLSWMSGPDALNLWHPLTSMSHALLLRISVEPWLHHGANVLLHVLCAVLCHRLFFLLMRSRAQAAITALLFALHPWNAEPVAWITARKDLLCTAFTLGGLLAWSHWDTGGRRRHWLLSAALAVAAMCSKPAGVVFPGLALVCSLWLRGAGLAAGAVRWRTLLPLILPAGVVAWMTVHFQAAGGHADLVAGRDLADRVLLAAASVTHYFRTAFWPGAGEFFVYPPEGSARTVMAAAGGGILIVLSAAAFGLRRRVPGLGCGWLWMLLCWLPVSGLVPVSFYLAADRYMHLAQAGLWAGLTALAAAALPRRIWTVSMGAAVAVFSVLTFSRLALWRDSLTFFSAEMERNPRSLLAPVQAGDALLRAGRAEEALTFFERARRTDPRSALAMTNCGLARLRLGQKEAAAADFAAAIQAGGNKSPRPWIELGRLRAEDAAHAAALQIWAQGALAFPGHPGLLRAEADCRAFQMNDPGGALPLYDQLLRRQPDDAAALRDSGLALCALGRREDGLHRLRAYLRINPSDTRIAEFAAKTSAGP